MNNITIEDLLLMPIYIIIIYTFALKISKNQNFVPFRLKKYFFWGLNIKIISVISISFLFEFYYKGGGDSFNFFKHIKIINSALDESIFSWFRLITQNANNSSDMKYLEKMFWYEDNSSYTTIIIGSIIGLMSFSKYLIINIILSFISFLCAWWFYIHLVYKYNLKEKLAIAILFVPSLLMWGSGLYKDTICLSALFISFVTFEKIFKRSNKLILLIIFNILSLYLIYKIKIYILICFLPLIILKVSIDNIFINNIIKYKFYFLLIFCIYTLAITSTSFLFINSINFDSIFEQIYIQKKYLLENGIVNDGSPYDLGDFEPTIQSTMQKFWPSVNVTLFRPYIWESNKIIILFASFESTLIMLFTIYIIIKIKLRYFIKILFSDSMIIFSLIFTILFAFFTGISSYNFGALSRYKIPCIPFYLIMLILINDKSNKFKSFEQ